MITEQELLHIGRIVRTHGTGGELQCRMTNTCWEDNDATFIILSVDGIYVPFRVTDWRTKGSEDVLLLMQGVSSEQQAARFVGCEAYMLRTDLPEQAAEYDRKKALAKDLVTDDLFIEYSRIKCPATGYCLCKYEDLIEQIDINNKRILARLPEGLL